MKKKEINFIAILALLIAILTLVFGNNIYQQITGHSFFQNTTSTKIPTSNPDNSSNAQPPAVESGKYKVAMVLYSSHDDGGWSQAHYDGLMYVSDNVPNVQVTYIENVPEGTDSEEVFRGLASQGNNLIFGTSFGYMDSMEKVASTSWHK